MAERDYNLGMEKFPEQIELCGVCGRRIHRMPPDQSRLYCEKCGHGADKATVVYTRGGALVNGKLTAMGRQEQGDLS